MEMRLYEGYTKTHCFPDYHYFNAYRFLGKICKATPVARKSNWCLYKSSFPHMRFNLQTLMEIFELCCDANTIYKIFDANILS